VRAVLIGAVVGDVVGGALNIWANTHGLFNSFGWSSVIVYALLLLGALYCLFTDPRPVMEEASAPNSRSLFPIYVMGHELPCGR